MRKSAKKRLIIFAQNCVKVSPEFAAVCPDYFDQLKCVPNREFSVFSSVGRGNLGNYSKPRRNFDSLVQKNMKGFLHFTA